MSRRSENRSHYKECFRIKLNLERAEQCARVSSVHQTLVRKTDIQSERMERTFFSVSSCVPNPDQQQGLERILTRKFTERRRSSRLRATTDKHGLRNRSLHAWIVCRKQIPCLKQAEVKFKADDSNSWTPSEACPSVDRDGGKFHQQELVHAGKDIHDASRPLK